MAEDWIQLKKKATSYAMRRGMEAIQAEDFSSYICMRKVEGTYSTLQWMFVDFLRLDRCDHRVGKGVAKHLALKNRVSLEEVKHNVAAPLHLNPESIFALIRSWKLKERERVIVLLFFYWGFTQKEIAELFEVDDARISQILKAIYVKSKKRVLK
jgi:hypothetical protein